MNALQRLLTFVLATKLYSDYSRSKAVSGKCTISTMFALSMFSYGNDVFLGRIAGFFFVVFFLISFQRNVNSNQC